MPISAATVLILDDDPDITYAAQILLRRHVASALTANDPITFTNLLHKHQPDLVLLDMNFAPGRIDGGEGMALLEQLLKQPRPPEIIAITAYADVPLAVAALKRGATDFVTKPWNNAHLIAAVEAALSRRTPMRASNDLGLLGDSPAMQGLRSLIANVAPTTANILILGENGVGKELVARAIHQASPRAAANFLAVDMGSLPDTMLESELFGHRKGAFTDARSDRSGRFQAASGGTLFLDEIGNLPLSSQAKLLTALERREVTPLGADRPEAFDVRIVSATNLEEGKLYDANVFRSDLLFRLNTIVLRVPSLRQRADDIPLLLNHYLAHYQRQYSKHGAVMTTQVLEALCNLEWLGNVRALRHACERAVIMAQADAYTLADFGVQEAATPHVQQNLSNVPAGTPLQLDVLERDAVNNAMQQAQGNISRAAKLLGISRAALYRKLEKHAL